MSAWRKWTKLLELKRGYKVLDVVTNTGKNLSILRKNTKEDGLVVVGINISFGMLEYAKRIAKRY